MSWLELSVQVDNESVESVSELLARYGYNGGVVAEPAWTPGDEGPEFSYDLSRPVTLRTYIPLDAQAEDVRQRLEQALWHFGQIRPMSPLQARTLEEEDWANAWKQHYSILRVGERTVVVPSWLEYEPKPDDVAIYLDPGMAFGTGLHPTTQLCLRLLERYARPGLRTLDIGAGSGILAIAAAKLGAGPILALDNDPVAAQVAAENVQANKVAHIVTAATGSLGAGQRMGHWLSGDFGSQESGVRSQESGVRSQESGVRSQESGVRSQESGVRSQESGVRSRDATDSRPPTPDSQFDLIAANLIAKVLVILAADLAEALAPGGTLISSGIIDTKESDVAEAFAAVGLRQVERHIEGEWLALVHTR